MSEQFISEQSISEKSISEQSLLPPELNQFIARFEGKSISSPLRDASVGAQADTGRWQIKIDTFSGDENIQLCVAAWHALLHWLRYDKEPVITCLLAKDRTRVWPLVSEIQEDSHLIDLHASICKQWPKFNNDWLNLEELDNPLFADHLLCHAICVNGIVEDGQPTAEFELIYDKRSWWINGARSIFSEAYLLHMRDFWLQLIEQFQKQPRHLLSNIYFLKDEVTFPKQVSGESRQLTGNLLDKLNQCCSEYGSVTAIIDGDKHYTYAEVDVLSDIWADNLYQQGVTLGDAVGVAFPRNANMVIAQLAVLKAGAAFVPLDTSLPADRLESMVADATIKYLLTEQSQHDIVEEKLAKISLIYIENVVPASAGTEQKRRAHRVYRDDAAYIIFTSGSTGVPKGVKVSHGNLLNFVTYFNDAEYIRTGDTVSQFAPFSFDASVAEIHSAILNGATLVILGKELIDSPVDLQAYMAEKKVTFAAFPPQYLQHLSPEFLPSLKTLLTAGSAPNYELIKKWLPHVRYVNGYGPTETTVLSTVWEADALPAPDEPISMGVPIANTHVRVVNQFGHSLPAGFTGELIIGGDGVVQGYVNREHLNKEKFLDEEHTRWYRSGDLACFNKNNQLIFNGRVDNQIKLRGHRLEPGEVEAAVAGIDGIDAAAVVVHKSENALQLVLFIQGKEIAEADLRLQLQARVPQWAMPNRIHWLEQLPLTTNGKINYQILQRLAAETATASTDERVELADGLEQQVAAIWQQTLQSKTVAREDNFLFLGGDSLTALAVVSALRKLGYAASSAQLLAQPRLKDFVALLKRSGKTLVRDYRPQVGETSITPIQGWFFSQPLANPQRFCQSLVFESVEQLDVTRLQHALAQLVSYHDELRASFVVSGSKRWTQRIEAESIPLPEIVVETIDVKNLDTHTALLQQSLADQLRIEQAPLFRVALLNSAAGSRVVWVIHHLIVDTLSHSLLLNDLHQLYVSDANVESVLPGKSLSYFAWAGRLQDQLAGKEQELLQPWKATLASAAMAPELPIGNGAESTSLGLEECRFDAQQTARLLSHAPDCYHQSPEELVLAGVYLALGQTFGSAQLGIDIEWHGRDEIIGGAEGLDRTLGWFTSVHPLFLTLPDFSQDSEHVLGNFLRYLKEERAAVPARGRDFYALRYLSNHDEVRTAFQNYRAPSILFNFSGVVQRSTGSWKTLPVAAIEMGEGNQNPYLLSVESEIRTGELIVGFYLDKSCWNPQQIDSLQRNLQTWLKAIVEHCTNPANHQWTPSDFPLVALTNEDAAVLPENLVDLFPLTDMQQTLYRHRDTYQVWMHHEFKRKFDQEKFQAAVADWISLNACLRTLIHTRADGSVVQGVYSSLPHKVELMNVASGQRQQTASELIAKGKNAPVEFTDHPAYTLHVLDAGESAFSLVLSIHHIIHDGWTIELLMDSLWRIYRSKLGEAVELPESSSTNVRDVFLEQQRIANDPQWNTYWSSVQWADNYCQLPKRAGAREASGNVELLLSVLPAKTVTQLQRKARELGLTLNSLFIAGFICLMRYLGGSHQVRVGLIQNGRPETIPDANQITGCCVNTLPLVVDFTAHSSLETILSTVQQQLLALRDCAVYPLSSIHQQARSQIEGNLFDCLFNIESSHYGSASGDEKPLLKDGYEATNYGFIFGLIEQAGETEGTYRYGLRIGFDTALYAKDKVECWTDCYAHLLELLADDTQLQWNQIQPIPAIYKENIAAWNQTTVPYPADVLLGEHFADVVKRVPEKIALAFKDIRLTYAELDQQTDKLARLLASKGAAPGVVIGLVAERSLEMVLGILAVIRSGAAYVPIDPRYPEDRVSHMLEDLRCPVILLQKDTFRSSIPAGFAAELIEIQSGVSHSLQLPAVDTSTHQTRQLAYVMYTSGSTGKPKGVMIEQRSIVRLIKNARDVEFDETDCILITSAPGFDVTTFELWGALLNGLTLAVIDEDTLLDPVQLAHEIRAKQVTFLWVVAPLFNQLVQARPDLFAGVKRIMIGGDALSPYHINLAREHSPGLAFINGYGPTENTSFSTYHFLSEADSEIIPIGRPITNSTAYIVNPDGHLLPAGVKGELYVGGPGVARGYYQRPELTQEKFVPNPFFADEDQLYRTGDLVSWRDNGLIDFYGRIDFQIKIRGFRVELGEIETVILNTAPVRQALVMAFGDGNQKRLVAYLVPDQLDISDATQAEKFREQLRNSLHAELPDYMVPDVIILLDAMPLSANGKIDRPRLPKPDLENFTRTLELPANDTEQQLLAIWKDVLKLDAISVTDDFYTIGGDSIIAIQVVSRSVKAGLALSTRRLFELRNIRAIASYLRQSDLGQSSVSGAAQPQNGIATIEQEAVTGEQRLLPIHWHFFLSDSTDLHHYNQAGRLSLPAPTTLENLHQLLVALVQRHDALRLKFRQTPGGWVARYSNDFLEQPEQLRELIRELDLRALTDSTHDEVLQAAIAIAQSGIDLKKGELCRWLWVREQEGDSLYWIMHHLIVDGISWRTLLNDLNSAWLQLEQNLATQQDRPIQLAAKTHSYQAWASRLYEHAHSPSFLQERSYWLDVLKQPSRVIPLDTQDAVDLTEANTRLYRFSLSTEQTHSLLHEANRCYSTSINDLLLSSLTLALDHWAGIRALRIDLEGHGREPLFDDIDISETLGWFTSLYPVHLQRVNGDTGQQILAIKAMLANTPNKGIGFGLLQYLTQDEDLLELLAEQPASEVVFNYLGQMDAAGETDWTFEILETGTVSAKRARRHTLGINGFVKDKQLHIALDYSTTQFEEATITRFGEAIQHSIEQVIEHCTTGGDDDGGVPPREFEHLELSRPQQQELEANYPGLVNAYPATSMQQGLILATQRDHGTGAYLTQLRMTLVGLDKTRFRKSWDLLVQQYSVLRTAFVDVGLNSLTQVVAAEVDLDWQETDCPVLAGESADEHAQRLESLFEAERRRPFNLNRAPLMRLLLVQTTPTETQVAWTHHHALLDGWSMGLLLQKLIAQYAAFARIGNAGDEQNPANEQDFDKYIQWLSRRDLSAAKDYWKTYLKGVEAGSGLAAPRHLPEPAETTGQRAATRNLDAQISGKLQSIVRTAGVTLSSLVQSAWALLLSKYTGEKEVLFGYAVSGRPADLDGVENMVGLFINSLPMRLTLEPSQPLVECLKRVQQRQAEAEEFAYVALTDIQKWLGLRTDQALFESLVVLENYPLDRSLLKNSRPEDLQLRAIKGVEQNDFPLNLVIYPGTSITVKLAYQSHLYSPEAADTILAHFCELLASIAEGQLADIEHKSLADVGMLTSAGVKQAVFTWNYTLTPLPTQKYLFDLFEEQAKAQASARALVMGESVWTYGELSRRVWELAYGLHGAGIKAGDRVAIMLPKSPDLVAALLAIIKLGAAYVPVATDCPHDRLEFIARDAGIERLLTNREHKIALADLPLGVLDIDQINADDTKDSAKHKQANTESGKENWLAPDRQAAYVIYTSGTTGQPKGVEISHENLINFCRSCQRDQWILAGTKATQFAPFTFDASVGETFAVLLAGAELHLLGDSLIQNPDAVGKYLQDNNIGFAAFPPPYLEQIPVNYLPAELTLVTAGSAPGLEWVRVWGERCRYINAYGPTETTILSSCWHFDGEAIRKKTLPIGSPIANTQLYVVDQYNQLCPPGVIGEILIGGAGVALGYLNRAQLTAEKFIADPWRPGNPVYRTGDLGYWLADGTIEFAGRRDNQVKIRGFRIELGEIEFQLREVSGVGQAAVVVKGEGAEKQLLAWVVPEEKANDSINDPIEFVTAIRTTLRSKLADYMIPQGFMVIDSLPLTANGKVDNKALLAADIEPIYEGSYLAPTTPLQSKLCEIWANLLNVDVAKLGINANFFDIGGHSLLAMRMVSEIGRELQVQVAVSDVFALGTIARLAGKLEQQEAAVEVIQPVDRSGLLPVSFSQQRLWFIDRLEGGSAQYNQPIVLRLSGALDKAALQAALDGVVARHEVLRTTYSAHDGLPKQQVNSACSFPIIHHDLLGLPQPQQTIEVDALVDKEANTPFDLSADLMVRARLLVLAEQESLLLLTLHHIASDGWSLSVFTDEFVSLYESALHGKENSLAPLALQYGDYAHWQRTHMQGYAQALHRDYWLEQLQGLPQVHSLPLDKPRPATQSYNGAAITRELNPALTQSLRGLARQQHATLFMLINAAFTSFLRAYTGADDQVIGTTIANREQSGVAGLIGFFVNTLVLRNRLDPAMTFTELLAHCKTVSLEAYAHQEMPFDLLVEELQPERSLGYNPVFQIMLSLENIDNRRELDMGGVKLSVVDSAPVTTSQFDLTLDIHEGEDQLVLSWSYATDLFYAATIERMAAHFEHLLSAIVANPELPLYQINRLADDQRAHLLYSLNNTDQPELFKTTWPECFLAQAHKTPLAIAAQCDDHQLSYADLEVTTRHIALQLNALGVGHQRLVALLDYRGLDLLVMMIAVLRAGAAYVPLDPNQPQERWLTILTEANPDLLVCGNLLQEQEANISSQWQSEKVLAMADIGQIEFNPGASLPEVALDDLAYVIYTSGSTGKPKGVMIEHRGMINNMLSKVDPLSLGESDVIAQTASQCFDISVWQFLTAVILGAKVCIITDDTVRDPQAMVEQLAALEVTIWEPVPSVIQAVLPLQKPLTAMRWVMPTGEALNAQVVARWFELYPHIPLMNAYGPAECSDDVAFQRMDGPVERVLIGTPVANAYLHVVDDFLELVPIGVTGELAISGAVVGRGYLNLPQQTEQQFRVNPYARHELDQRLYLTGDLVRRVADGGLEYIGRKDFQVKIRGFRIELGEIEARLREHPAIGDCVVAAVERSPGNQQLVAYVVAVAAVDNEALHQHLQHYLPDYMLPKAIVRLAALPLTPNGKVDRKVLPAPEPEAWQTASYVAPIGTTETLLASLWGKILNLPQVGREDNFFRLGGHSLLIIQMIDALREQGLTAAVRQVFETENLAQLAALIDSNQQQDAFVAPPNLIPSGCTQLTPELLPLIDLTAKELDSIVQACPGGAANIQDIYPLTPLQEGILFDHLLSDSGDTYLASVLLAFDSRPLLDTYVGALQHLVNRHDTLRTAILWDGLPRAVQVVLRDAPVHLEILTPESGVATIDRLKAQMELEGRYIDLTRAPILTLVAAQEEHSGRWLLLQQQHHIVCDQVSMGIEFRDILAFLQQQEDSLPEPVAYREFVAQGIHKATHFNYESYFRESLAGIDEPTAPFGLLDTHRADRHTEELELALDPQLAQRLRACVRKLDTTPAAFFHVLWSLVLAKCCNRDDVVFGTVTSGRLQGTRGVENIFGLFINMLPVRFSMADLSVADALKLAHKKLVELLDYEQAPLVKTQSCADLPASTPLFSAVLNFRHEDPTGIDPLRLFPGIEVLSAPGDISNYLFDLSITDRGDDFVLTTSIASDIGTQRVMDYILRAAEELIVALETAPAKLLLSLPVVGQSEEQQLLADFNHPLQPELFSQTWPMLFAEQVARHPTRILAECNGKALSYAQLYTESEKLAQALRTRGIGPGQIVGLLDERDLDLLIMIVAVLRAGAAYLPLDPTQPEQRWVEILNDGQPDLLLIGKQFGERKTWLEQHWNSGAVAGLEELASTKLPSSPEPLPSVALDDLAYVLFTSGSTGKPKGVMIEHLGMINNMRAKIVPLGLSNQDVIAQTASQCFDISVWQFLIAPILGAKVVIVKNETTRDPQALLDCLANTAVTIWEPVPSVIQALLPLKQPLPALRWVMPTGEALSANVVEQWFAQYPQVPLMNAYGPAECSDDVSFQPIHAPVARVFIGSPVANARLHVVDKHLSLLPVGVIGELAISGPVVGRGYLHRPELTAEVFKANPFALNEQDARLYLTGDLVKRHDDGNLEYIGRKDFQVKVRGFRIEPGEIENRLARHPQIRDAVVMARTNAQGDKYLAAYVSPKQTGKFPTRETLMAYLEPQLPDYMVPGIYVNLEAMPLNHNGKVDRKALPEPEIETVARASFSAPQGEVEHVVARIWQNLLGIERVGRDDNFFDLGGNSILIIRMLSELKAEGITLRASDIYQQPVLKVCCSHVVVAKRNLDNWLQDIKHEKVQVKSGSKSASVLLVDRRHSTSIEILKSILGDESAAKIPDFVRYCDDPVALAHTIRQKGLAALPEYSSATAAGKIIKDLDAQLDAFEHMLIGGEIEEAFRFSPMQEELLQWKTRDDFEWLSLHGWYTATELRTSFNLLMNEQDLLRSLLDEKNQQWKLISSASLKANFPYIDLSAFTDSEATDLMKRMFKKIREKKTKSVLPYMGTWIKRSDTLHQLMMFDDHFISDGTSSLLLQQRLEYLVKGKPYQPNARYRDYINSVWSKTDTTAAQIAADTLALEQTSAMVKVTNKLLEERKSQPLRSVLLKIPMQEHLSEVDQAFHWFKHWVTDLLGAESFVMIMNHYGRRIGATNYFDQIGLFMDKVPFLVESETKLQSIGNKIELLIKNGISYMALEKSGHKICQDAFPGLRHEILFNYEGELGEYDQMQALLAEQKTEEKLKDFCGVLFEAYSQDGDLVIHCAFRGNSAAEKRLLQVIPGKILNARSTSRSWLSRFI